MIQEVDYTERAELIGESGRWKAFDVALSLLQNTPDLHKPWRIKVLFGLGATILKEYKKLKEAFSRDDNYLPNIAFHARNLLELCVWTSYVSISEENARRFHLDSSVDPMELVRAAENWGNESGQNAEWMQGFPDAKDRLIANAHLQDDENLNGKYRKVEKVAAEVGLEKIYQISYKMLSKHAHPTAWVVMMHDNTSMISALRKTFFNQGCWLFIGAFDTLEKHVQSLSTKTT